MKYFRVTFRLPENKRKHAWVEQVSSQIYRVLNKYGGWTGEIIIATDGDVINKSEAYMSKKYAVMQIGKESYK